MAVSALRVTVAAVAVALNTADPTSGLCLVVRNTSANAASLGAAGVLAGTGYLLNANTSLTVELDPGDVLFAIREGAGDALISVLAT